MFTNQKKLHAAAFPGKKTKTSTNRSWYVPHCITMFPYVPICSLLITMVHLWNFQSHDLHLDLESKHQLIIYSFPHLPSVVFSTVSTQTCGPWRAGVSDLASSRCFIRKTWLGLMSSRSGVVGLNDGIRWACQKLTSLKLKMGSWSKARFQWNTPMSQNVTNICDPGLRIASETLSIYDSYQVPLHRFFPLNSPSSGSQSYMFIRGLNSTRQEFASPASMYRLR